MKGGDYKGEEEVREEDGKEGNGETKGREEREEET